MAMLLQSTCTWPAWNTYTLGTLFVDWHRIGKSTLLSTSLQQVFLFYTCTPYHAYVWVLSPATSADPDQLALQCSLLGKK
jgi:hypothetical protein